MSAIVGESLFYGASKIIQGNDPLSYYQYKSLDSFIELIALHDSVALFLGEDADEKYLESFYWLIEAVHDHTDCNINIISAKHRDLYITDEVMSLFEQICREIYLHPLGITSNDLFSKQSKDRTSEDMSERIEQLFARDYPTFNCKKFGQRIYGILQKNINSSELLYFFRAHLLQAIAESQDLTPIYENQRLIAAIFHKTCRIENRVGTLPYTIYKMVDNLFIKAYNSMPGNKTYPRASILMNAITENSSSRKDIIDAIVSLREELKEFRGFYRRAEKVWSDPDKSVVDRTKIRSLLDESAQVVWGPLLSSLGRNYTSNKIKKIAKGIFGKYGIGEIKLQHEEKKNSSDSKATFSTPSLIGVITAITQTGTEFYKESKLEKPNKPLLDIIIRVVNLTDTRQKLSSLLPIRSFNYKVSRLIDSLLVED